MNKYILKKSTYIESENCDDRSADIIVDTIIIHCISLPEKEYDNDNVISFFTNKLNFDAHESFKDLEDLKVSSHLFIRRSGEVIQFVPFNKKAWHAGKSRYKERENFNEFSIGIELEGSVDDSYTDNQYDRLKIVIQELKELYPSIKDSNILRHSDIAPDRKNDPGEHFSLDRIK
jgi:AmpD protein